MRDSFFENTDLRYHKPESLLPAIKHIKVRQIFDIIRLFTFLNIELFFLLQHFSRDIILDDLPKSNRALTSFQRRAFDRVRICIRHSQFNARSCCFLCGVMRRSWLETCVGIWWGSVVSRAGSATLCTLTIIILKLICITPNSMEIGIGHRA